MKKECKLTTGNKYIDDYANAVLDGTITACEDLKLAMELLYRKFQDKSIIIDAEQTEKAIELIERYFSMKLFNWEKFILGLIHCYYPDDTLVFTEFLIVMGRGNGKNGFTSGLIWYLTTKAHGIKGYNVDIIANSEEQAKTSFNDVKDMLEDTWTRSRKFFEKPTKQEIFNKDTRSYIKYNTSSAKTKDGKRSAALVFDEIHEYENSDKIGVFKSGFGKRKHSRVFYITTNGYVREGVLDQQLNIAKSVLKGDFPNSRMLPLLYHIDDEEEKNNPDMWIKANPSLPYLPVLKQQMEQDLIDMKFNPRTELDFVTKRMNLPKNNMEIAVTEWDNVKATNRPLPDLYGNNCVVGIDYSKLNDWTSVSLLFREGNTRYIINHSFVCLQGSDLKLLRVPWREWAEKGYLTLIDEPEISPKVIADYIVELMTKYNIVAIGVDNFRYSLLADSLKDIGFDNKKKNLILTRPSDIYKIVPVIEHCFLNKYFVWGDNPPLRWATQNTMLLSTTKKTGIDTGNFYYAKIEGKSRKTDPFMSMVNAMIIEDRLDDGIDFSSIPYIPVITNV